MSYNKAAHAREWRYLALKRQQRDVSAACVREVRTTNLIPPPIFSICSHIGTSQSKSVTYGFTQCNGQSRHCNASKMEVMTIVFGLSTLPCLASRCDDFILMFILFAQIEDMHACNQPPCLQQPRYRYKRAHGHTQLIQSAYHKQHNRAVG